MPKEIWNQGRVTGLSAYEIYVKQHIASNPTLPVATEREWLASSLAMGNSLLLKFPASGSIITDDSIHYVTTIPLPRSSRLSAANTIVAQFFDGDAELDANAPSGRPWAIRVSDYGQTISNTSASHPSSGYHDPTLDEVPYQTPSELTDDQKKCLLNYSKILDGCIISPGTWADVTENPQNPYMDFQPNFSSGTDAVLRCHVKGKIDSDHRPWVLLTGFTIKNILDGVVGSDGSVNDLSDIEKKDGEFLGPAIFPWAAKVTFILPNAYAKYLSNGVYGRSIKSGASKTVTDTPIIDMRETDPGTYYGSGYSSRVLLFSTDTTDPRVSDSISNLTISGPAGSILTVYQKDSKYPPALYGTFASSDGSNYLNPLDVVAPGTVKMFNYATQAQMQAYQDDFPGTAAISRTTDGRLQFLDSDGDLSTLANTELAVGDIDYTNPNGSSVKANYAKVTIGSSSILALALGEGTSGSQYTISTSPSSMKATATDDNIAWSLLLEALANNKSIDILGARLKATKSSLIRPHGSTTDDGPYIIFGPGTGTGANFGLRLYISSTAPDPTDVPIGSIGIGWGLES